MNLLRMESRWLRILKKVKHKLSNRKLKITAGSHDLAV